MLVMVIALITSHLVAIDGDQADLYVKDLKDYMHEMEHHYYCKHVSHH